MYRGAGVTLGGQATGEVERLTSMQVTPSFFRLLGAEPLRGQLFTEKEARGRLRQEGRAERGAVAAAVRRPGRCPRPRSPHQRRALYRHRRDAGTFRFVDPEVQLWTPVAFTPAQRSDAQRHSNNWQQIGRLKPGRTFEQAQAQIDAINAANLERFPQLKEVLINAGFRTVTQLVSGGSRRRLEPDALSALGRRAVRC